MGGVVRQDTSHDKEMPRKGARGIEAWQHTTVNPAMEVMMSPEDQTLEVPKGGL